jgi:hypothetical protein
MGTNSGRTRRIEKGAFQTLFIEERPMPEVKKASISRLSQLADSEARQIHKDVQNLSMALIVVFFNSLSLHLGSYSYPSRGPGRQ